MKEIEVKILEIDREAILKKLDALEAQKSFDGEMLALFYDDANGSIAQRQDVLRLRKEGGETVLTYKKFVSQEGAKIMEEYETKVEEVGQMQTILDLLGFQVGKKTRKFRTQFELGDTHIVIDNYQDELAAIPEFIEIEAPSEARMQEVVELLGFSAEDCKSWHTFDLVKHYKLTQRL